MANSIETEPPNDTVTAPERTFDQLAADRALDEKLVRAATDKRARVAAQGGPKPLTNMRVLRDFATAPTPPDQPVVRISAAEGDQPEPSPTIKSALVPTRFRSASFDSYDPQTRSQSGALNSVREWVGMATAGEGPMLALIGNQGAGKSHLLYAALNAMLADRRSCYARPWYKLADELRYGGYSPFAPDKTLDAPEVRALLWRHRIVLLDEVRATASTAFDDTELAKYACHAYDSEIAVLLTTNVHPLAAVMGPPAASRFTQLVIEGPDWRQL